MFYCEEDRIKNDWPCSLMQSYGRCELCGKTAVCYDRPSSSLPDPKSKPKENSVKITRTEIIGSEIVSVPDRSTAISETLAFCRYLATIGDLDDFSITWKPSSDPNWIKFIATRIPTK
jgi:hypothetical protein